VVKPDLVAAKLAELAHRVARARAHCPSDPSDLAKDEDALDLVAFNLMVAVQTSADIASHIIADEGWPVVTSLAAGFQRLREKGVLSDETADALCRAVGLRNVVAHGYERIDAGRVHAAATRGINDLDAFAQEVSRWIRLQIAEPTPDDA